MFPTYLQNMESYFYSVKIKQSVFIFLQTMTQIGHVLRLALFANTCIYKLE
jgi:hypothetical protein